MLGALKTYARANQATIVTPFILAGACPGDRGGTVAQTFAEALAGMALAQLVNPGPGGARAFVLARCSPAPRRSARPSRPGALPHGRAGAPPGVLLGLGRAVRRQTRTPSAYESANTLVPICLGGVNFVLHTAGWLEGGLAMGYEVRRGRRPGRHDAHALAGVDLENGQALDAIREVGPGKHFSAAPTRRRTDRVLSLATGG
jgi:trimethylamine--corrinoid protein Co-methyltransferase